MRGFVIMALKITCEAALDAESTTVIIIYVWFKYSRKEF